MSTYDLFLTWVIGGKRPYFVPTPGQPGMMETNRELVWLDNTLVHFSRNKKPGAYRIFCIGGSTTRGWPFHEVFSYPRLLSLYLRDLLPGREIEVINAGLMSSDSTGDLGLLEELLGYQPDLILVYEGRNDAGNLAVRLSPFAGLLKLHAFLLHHVYSYGLLRRQLLPVIHDNGNRLHEFMERGFHYNENKARALFLGNLAKMQRMAKEHNCAIAFLTQVICSEEGEQIMTRKCNDWLITFCRQQSVPLIDTFQAFTTARLPEDELLIPYIYSVHPDFIGYALMARVVCRDLARQDVIAEKSQWRWENLKPDAHYYRETGLTPAALAATYSRLSEFFVRVQEGVLADRYAAKAAFYRDGHLPQ